MQLLSPKSLDEALKMMASASPPTPIAGGTDLLVSWHHRAHENLALMDLSRVPGLAEMRLGDSQLEMGALTTYWQVMQSRAVSEAFPLMRDAARQVGAVQIQTRGTWAGNIGNASPAADGVPVLMAYDAMVELASVRGKRCVALSEYYTGYKKTVRAADELIVGITVPQRSRTLEWFYKVGARKAQAITKVGVAVVHDEAGWRVVANSVAPFVCRCRNLEAALGGGKSFGSPDEIAAILQQDVAPIDDLRSTAKYRAAVLGRLLFYRLAQPQPA